MKSETCLAFESNAEKKFYNLATGEIDLMCQYRNM